MQQSMLSDAILFQLMSYGTNGAHLAPTDIATASDPDHLLRWQPRRHGTPLSKVSSSPVDYVAFKMQSTACL